MGAQLVAQGGSGPQDFFCLMYAAMTSGIGQFPRDHGDPLRS
jgi:hypothetical protein